MNKAFRQDFKTQCKKSKENVSENSNSYSTQMPSNVLRVPEDSESSVGEFWNVLHLTI